MNNLNWSVRQVDENLAKLQEVSHLSFQSASERTNVALTLRTLCMQLMTNTGGGRAIFVNCGRMMRHASPQHELTDRLAR